MRLRLGARGVFSNLEAPTVVKATVAARARLAWRILEGAGMA